MSRVELSSNAALAGGSSISPTELPLPTLAQCERAIGKPAIEWGGHCYEIACAIIDAHLLPTKAVAVYGHWRGPIADNSIFTAWRAATFVQHGWVLLPDKRVLDPTRWAFEGASPYLYTGPSDYYDEGGNTFREALMPANAPRFDPDERIIHFTRHAMPTRTWNFVERLLRLLEELPDNCEPGDVSINQLSWLANRNPDHFGPHGLHALAIYRAIFAVGEGGLIPIDNRRRVEREFCVEFGETP
jgi:hypothetical protein